MYGINISYKRYFPVAYMNNCVISSYLYRVSLKLVIKVIELWRHVSEKLG